MKEYNKIDAIFERDERTKKLIIGQYRDKTVEFCKDLVWQFTEKVDGTNCRIFWDGHRVTFGGRTDRAQIPTLLVNRLNELFGGDVNEELFEQKFGETPVILFGEGYGEKIQTNGYTEKGVNFILFDVMIGDNYQPRESVEDIARYFNLDIVPIILEGTLDDGVNWVLANRKSRVSTVGGEIEGLVGRPKFELKARDGKRLITKIKYKDFQGMDWADALKRKPELYKKLKDAGVID